MNRLKIGLILNPIFQPGALHPKRKRGLVMPAIVNYGQITTGVKSSKRFNFICRSPPFNFEFEEFKIRAGVSRIYVKKQPAYIKWLEDKDKE